MRAALFAKKLSNFSGRQPSCPVYVPIREEGRWRMTRGPLSGGPLPGSANFRKAEARLAKLHARIANIRRDPTS
jgi:hypothetical protein